MTVRRQSGRYFRAGSRRVAALVSLVCLNLAMLPCAMGLEQFEACPDCPTELTQDAHAHHANAEAEKSADCGNAHNDCCEVDDFSSDDRPQKPAKDGSEPFALTADPMSPRRSATAGVILNATGPPDPYPGSTRLHSLFCVYLD